MATERRAKKPRTSHPKKAARVYATEIQIQQRREEAMGLKVNGWSFRAIAKKLQVSVGTVHSDITALLDEIQESSQELARKERAAQLERLENRRAALLGLDAPTRVQNELSGSVSLDDIDALRQAAAANGCSPPPTSPPPAAAPKSGESEPSS